VSRYDPSLDQDTPLTSRAWPVVATCCVHMSSVAEYVHFLQLPVRPSDTTEFPSGDQSPIQNPPALPVALVEPFCALISPSLVIHTQTPELGSDSHIASELSSDVVSSCSFSSRCRHEAWYIQSSCPSSSASNVIEYFDFADSSQCALFDNDFTKPPRAGSLSALLAVGSSSP
jgi:hypothetical protein